MEASSKVFQFINWHTVGKYTAPQNPHPLLFRNQMILKGIIKKNQLLIFYIVSQLEPLWDGGSSYFCLYLVLEWVVIFHLCSKCKFFEKYVKFEMSMFQILWYAFIILLLWVNTGCVGDWWWGLLTAMGGWLFVFLAEKYVSVQAGIELFGSCWMERVIKVWVVTEK